MTDVINATTSLSSMSSVVSSLPPVAIAFLVFAVIVTMIFVLSKNFRRFIYGLSVLIPLTIIGWISKNIGVETASGNLVPIKVFGFIVAGIVVSILCGMGIERTKWIKKFEKDLNKK